MDLLPLFIGAFAIFVIAVLAMSVGVIVSNRRIRGSCGGLSAWRDEIGRPMCEACAECPEKKADCELEEREALAAVAAGETASEPAVDSSADLEKSS